MPMKPTWLLIATLTIGTLHNAACTRAPEETDGNNVLTRAEVNEGWKLLFNGRDGNGWRGYNSDSFSDEGWDVEDGVLVSRPGNAPAGTSWDIITDQHFENFILRLEWNNAEGGNSGIFYHVLEQPAREIYWSAPEIKILDRPPAPAGANATRLSGALYDLLAPDSLNARPHGEWNEFELIVDNPRVEHRLNGESVLVYERWTPDWFELIRNSKFACHPEFGVTRKGPIGLQHHGDEVRFRNIRIRELP
jgi:hypothetical protein